MRIYSDPFAFVVQILTFLASWKILPLPAKTLQPTAQLGGQGFQALHSAVNTPDCQAQQPFLWNDSPALCAPPSSKVTDASPQLYLNSWDPRIAFSGHGSAATMRVYSNPFAFLVRVGSAPSLYSKRSNNVCLLLLPCPCVMIAVTSECVHVVKLLIMSGDIESNPGPPKDVPDKHYNELLSLIKSLHNKIDVKHDELMESINEVKEAQSSLEQQITDLDNRLSEVEKHVSCPEGLPTQNYQPQVMALNQRLDDFEDRSRRENLIFHCLADSSSETWAQPQEKVCAVLNSVLNLNLTTSDDRISRAHRLGKFIPGKCRPIIVKFSSSK